MTTVFCDNKSCKHNLVGEICQKEKIDITINHWDSGEYIPYSICNNEELNELPL